MANKRRNIYNFNHISKSLADWQINELKELYKYYHKKYYLFKMSYKCFKKIELAFTLTSVVTLVVAGSISVISMNLIIIETVGGAGLILKSIQEKKNYKRKMEMYKFAYTTYEKILTTIRSYLRGIEYNNIQFLDYLRTIDDLKKRN